MTLLILVGCSDKPRAAGNEIRTAGGDVTTGDMAAPVADATQGPAVRTAPVSNEGGFQPLGSQAVKDAIHRALNSGETQRWSDAGLSGYAVPSPATDARGCRAVRYTIDQQPERSFPVITACDAR